MNTNFKPFTFIVVNRSRSNIIESKTYKNIITLLKKELIPFKVSTSFPFNRIDQNHIRNAQLMIILGGDGTILSVFKKIVDPDKVKIIPVNFGTLGYITSVDGNNVLPIIKHYLKGDKRYYKEDHRNLLSITYKNQHYFSLNEMVLVHKEPVRPITIDIRINNQVNTRFGGDGILISTPTGSTAYNLSARGPILSPDINAFILNPISAHSLNMKPIVLSSYDTLAIKTPDEAIVAIDGHKINISKDIEIHCSLAKETLHFIKPVNEHHYQILKNKFNWGG